MISRRAQLRPLGLACDGPYVAAWLASGHQTSLVVLMLEEGSTSIVATETDAELASRSDVDWSEWDQLADLTDRVFESPSGLVVVVTAISAPNVISVTAVTEIAEYPAVLNPDGLVLSVFAVDEPPEDLRMKAFLRDGRVVTVT